MGGGVPNGEEVCFVSIRLGQGSSKFLKPGGPSDVAAVNCR